MEIKLEFIEMYVEPLWRTVACAAVLSGRRANTVAGRDEHCRLPALVVGRSGEEDAWRAPSGAAFYSACMILPEWGDALGIVYIYINFFFLFLYLWRFIDIISFRF